MEAATDADHVQASGTIEEHGPTSRTQGNVTRDQYLSWLDSADAPSDSSSVLTNQGSDHDLDEDDVDSGNGEWDHHDGVGGGDDSNRFESLAVEHISEILTYLSLPERCRLAVTCRNQHTLRTDYLDGTVQTLSEQAGHGLSGLFLSSVTATPDWLSEVASLRRSRILQFSRLVGLKTLELGQLGSDAFLRLISGGGGRLDDDDGSGGGGGGGGVLLMPNLEHLSLVRSRGVTDKGLLTLPGPGGDSDLERTKLTTIDVTFCPNVTYGATVNLRKLLPNLRLVRRQPEWLDGHFETPFAGGTVDSQSAASRAAAAADREAEIHTYWPDGTFAFGRTSQSSGFVVDLFEFAEDDPNHLGDKLQYNDFDVPPTWPAWTRYAYRPGVSLLRVADEVVRNGDGQGEAVGEGTTTARSVLVAQCRRGLRPPKTFPKPEHVDVVPLGESRFFSHDGELLEGGSDGDDGRATDSRVMVSRMRVRPLSEDEFVPPEELTERNLAFVREMEAAQHEAPELAEDILQAALSGPDEEG